MRLLHVIHDFLPRHTAGSQLYCAYLARELRTRHDVALLFTEVDHTRPQYDIQRTVRSGIDCYEVIHNHQYRTFEETYDNPAMDAAFCRVLEEFQPDVVHLHHLLCHSIGYIDIARARGIPIVFTLHDYWLSCPNMGLRLGPGDVVCDTVDTNRCADCIRRFGALPRFASRVAGMALRRSPQQGLLPVAQVQAHVSSAKGLYKRIEPWITMESQGSRTASIERRLDRVRAACSYVDQFLAPSRFLSSQMTDFGISPDRIALSPLGMRSDLVRIARRFELPLRLGFIGTVAPHKGVHVLIAAFRRLLQRAPGSAVLKIHGSLEWFPDYVRALRVSAGDLPVEFAGEFEPGALMNVYNGLDVLIVPSIWWENAPLTIQESMGTGTPVIAPDLGSMAEFVQDGHNGLLYAAGDVGDLTEKFARLVREPALLSRLASHARWLRTIEQDAQDVERLYAQTIGHRRRVSMVASEATSGAGTPACV